MAKIKRQVKTVDKWKKKKWFTLLAPKMFQERPLGQTCCSDPDLLQKRTITVNLMSLTGNIKRQNTNIQFEAHSTQGEKILTHVKKIDLVPSFIKRKVRRHRDRIDESFICETKDKKHLRIKPMVVTASRTSRSVQTVLKEKLLETMVKTINNTTYEDLMQDIINFKLQRNIRSALSQTHPIYDVEIRSTVLLEEGSRNIKNVKTLDALKPKYKKKEAEEPIEEEAEETPKEPEAPAAEAPAEAA